FHIEYDPKTSMDMSSARIMQGENLIARIDEKNDAGYVSATIYDGDIIIAYYSNTMIIDEICWSVHIEHNDHVISKPEIIGIFVGKSAFTYERIVENNKKLPDMDVCNLTFYAFPVFAMMIITGVISIIGIFF